jgi:hypothetical protein
MLTWYIIGQVSARPSVVYGGTYVLNKPNGQVVLIPSIVLSLSLKKSCSTLCRYGGIYRCFSYRYIPINKKLSTSSILSLLLEKI